MILPVLQSLLTLVLLVAAFGFLFVRLRRIVRADQHRHAGRRGPDRQPARARGQGRIARARPQEGARGPLGRRDPHLLHLRLPDPRHRPSRDRPRGPDRLPEHLRPPAVLLRPRPAAVPARGLSTSARTCWPRSCSRRPRSRWRGAGSGGRSGCSRARRTPRTSSGSSWRSTSPSSCSTARACCSGSGALAEASAASQPFASLVAGALAFLPTGAVAALRGGAWWAHVLVFLGFAAYIPMTKHMHLVFATPNIYLFRRKGYGLPPKIDFETTEKFGVDRVQELPWKTLLDTFACTECGRCNDACPAHATGKPLKPMKVLRDIKMNLLYRNGADILRFRDAKGRPLAGQGRRGGRASRRRRRSSPRARSIPRSPARCARTARTARSRRRCTSTRSGPAPRARPASRSARC